MSKCCTFCELTIDNCICAQVEDFFADINPALYAEIKPIEKEVA